MRQFICAFVTVVVSVAAGAGYALLFSDEMNPRDRINNGAGVLAPVYRHCMEFVIVIWTAMLQTMLGWYWITSARNVVINWQVARRYLFALHATSGALMVTGLVLSAAFGKPVQIRDGVTALIGLALLAAATWDLLNGQE